MGKVYFDVPLALDVGRITQIFGDKRSPRRARETPPDSGRRSGAQKGRRDRETREGIAINATRGNNCNAI